MTSEKFIETLNNKGDNDITLEALENAMTCIEPDKLEEFIRTNLEGHFSEVSDCCEAPINYGFSINTCTECNEPCEGVWL